jgi:hypothetical protein
MLVAGPQLGVERQLDPTSNTRRDQSVFHNPAQLRGLQRSGLKCLSFRHQYLLHEVLTGIPWEFRARGQDPNCSATSLVNCADGSPVRARELTLTAGCLNPHTRMIASP